MFSNFQKKIAVRMKHSMNNGNAMQKHSNLPCYSVGPRIQE